MDNATKARKIYPSPARQAFLERTKKAMPSRHASALYINTTDPAYYEKLLRCNRHNVKALYYLGREYEKQGLTQRAQEYYERAVSVNPHFEPALGALHILRRKQEIQQQKDAHRARREAEQRKKAQRSMSLFRTMQAMMICYLIILLIVFGIILR